jgi:transitional endoplasmic reticulum ATPase
MTVWIIILVTLMLVLIIGVIFFDVILLSASRSDGGGGGDGAFSRLLNTSVWHWIKPEDLPGWTVEKLAKGQLRTLAMDEDVRRDVEEIIYLWRGQSSVTTERGILAAHPPRGLFIAGPTGSGKTTLAHAIARDLGWPLCIVDSSAVSGILIGMAAIRLKEVFAEAAKKAPCVLLLDQFEALGRRHSGERMLASDIDAKSVVLQLANRIEAARGKEILVIAATGNLDAIDPNLLRRGVFDETVHLDLPLAETREAILGQVLEREAVPVHEMVVLGDHACGREGRASTAGFAAADLEEVVHRAVRVASREGAVQLSADHLESAVKRVRAGVTRRSANEESGLRRHLARLYEPITPVTFDAVGGLGKVKEELLIVADYLRRPSDYASAGAHIPRGVLLAGPPGVGKTLLARALAGQASVPFFFLSGSDFGDLYSGVAAARVRDLFRVARRHGRCVVFIDEIDALGSRAVGEAGQGGGALHQLLVEMSGLETEDNFVIMGATNRPESLDRAIVRSGRLGEPIILPLPTREERAEILKVHVRPGELDTATHDLLLDRSDGRTGADLEWVLNTARLRATYRRRPGSLTTNNIAGLDRLDCSDIEDALKRLGARIKSALDHP